MRKPMQSRASSWIRNRGVGKTAQDLGVVSRSVTAYLSGLYIPRIEKAAAMIQLAAAEGVTLSLDDVYGDPLKISTKPKKERDA